VDDAIGAARKTMFTKQEKTVKESRVRVLKRRLGTRVGEVWKRDSK